MSDSLPKSEYALQLVGQSELKLNKEKPIFKPGEDQILCKVEAAGLCFSDLKLLKQFSDHARKSEVIAGIDPEKLKKIPSYVPGDKPTVPGHETVVRIVEVGPGVSRFKKGERFLVQSDFRWLKTKINNGAFGYNFEGALQEYILLDTNVIISPEGESMLLPVGEDRSASAVALVEPWACVEDAYITKERREIKAGGKLLVVVDAGRTIKGLTESFSADGNPSEITLVGEDKANALKNLSAIVKKSSIESLEENSFDDVVYFGSDKDTITILEPAVGRAGIFNIVLGGKKIGEKVTLHVGRVHYGLVRFIGTMTDDASESYKIIPATGELRANDKVQIIGAGGPMGVMHVIRHLCQGVPGIQVVATDFDDNRLAVLSSIAEKLAAKNNVGYVAYNPQKETKSVKPSYVVLMAPVAALVEQGIQDCVEGGEINMFAGIAATVEHAIDLDQLISKKIFIVGTSGSTLEDMKIVLKKVEAGQLDTNFSVAAVSGMAGAADGIHAVENRLIPGKILVYPMLHDLDLTPLPELEMKFPTVYAKLDDGHWTKEAEEELVKVGNGQ